ncbi:LptF/LptG family permease [Flavitalea flava]
MIKPLIKKLDLLIIKAFIGPFIATFFITLFVLVLQFFWLYIDDIVGKGVDLFTVLRLISYVSATLVPLALPLAVLLSSIMTFGNLGETFELIAIKAAGIPLLRFMRPLFFVSLVVCYIAFLFNNNLIPIANLKMNTLKYDIIMSKPAFDIKEGVFYDRIEGYVIKIGKKEKDDSTIRSVVIYEQDNAGVQDDIIVAEKGKMVVSANKKFLVFTLQNGWTYREKGDRGSLNTEFVRLGFKEYKKVLDLTSFKLNKTDDSAFKNNYMMLSMRQLTGRIDSLEKVNMSYLQRVSRDMKATLKFPKAMDSAWIAGLQAPSLDSARKRFDSATKAYAKATEERTIAENRARDSVNKVRDSLAKKNHTGLAAWKGRDSLIKGLDGKLLNGNDLDSARKSGIVILRDSVMRTHDTAFVAKVRDSMRRIQDSISKAAVMGRPGGPGGNVQTGNATNNPANHKDSASKLADANKKTAPRVMTFLDMLPDSTRNSVLDRTISTINGVKSNLDQPAYLFENEENDLRLHLIAWHEKLTLSVACLVMFLIGAPLGSIIRKGGIGLPLIFAVVFFVIFFLLNNFGKKFVKQDVMTPFAGMWMATYVLTPIGIFLIYKALHDSQLFNKEFYFRVIRDIRTFIQKRKEAKLKAAEE